MQTFDYAPRQARAYVETPLNAAHNERAPNPNQEIFSEYQDFDCAGSSSDAVLRHSRGSRGNVTFIVRAYDGQAGE